MTDSGSVPTEFQVVYSEGASKNTAHQAPFPMALLSSRAFFVRLLLPSAKPALRTSFAIGTTPSAVAMLTASTIAPSWRRSANRAPQTPSKTPDFTSLSRSPPPENKKREAALLLFDFEFWWSLRESDARLTQDKRRCQPTENPCIIAYFGCDELLVSRRPLNHVIFSPKKYAKASWF